MSVVTINYHYLNNMITQAGKADEEFEDYNQAIDKQFISKLSSLEGSDEAGHISTALTLAREKKKKINEYRTNVRKLKNDLSNLKAKAESADKAVSKKISSLSKAYEKKQSWFQKVGSAVYGFFCDAGAFLSESVLGELFVNAVSKAWTALVTAKEYVRDWFKYGAGKYIANIISAVLAVVGVVVAIVGAVVGAPFVLAVIALVAGTIALVYAIGNMVVATEQNSRALEYQKKGQLGMARYYGNQTTVKKMVERTDFGGKKENKRWENFATGYEIVGKSASLVLTVCGIINSFHQLRAVKNGKTGEVIRYQKPFNKDGKLSNVIIKNMDTKWQGFKHFFFGKSKSYAFWFKDPKKSFDATIDTIKLIVTVTDSSLKFYGGTDNTIDTLEKAWNEPSVETISKAVKSIVSSNLMPNQLKNIFKYSIPVAPASSIISDLSGLGKTNEDLRVAPGHSSGGGAW